MQLTVLGSNGTYGTPGRPPSGYLVEHEGTRIWMDAGPGTFAALQDQLDPGDLDGIVLTHVHGDHCLDIFGFYYAMRFGRRPGLIFPTYVPEGLEDRLVGFLEGGEPRIKGSHPISDVLDFRIMGAGGSTRLGPLTLRFAIAEHPVPTLCVRIEADGRSLTFSADTGVGGGLAGLAAGTNLLLCEATYQGAGVDKPWPHHLTAGEAGEVARAAGAGALMLTHIWPTLDPARSVAEAEGTFGRPVALAVPGISVKV
ncbi:MAG: MBL fold metallo-hydrolase [Acidimicrobiia bacterium]|nr:MBL fold metallo-hydrolase [Acidimicrobiia bacterium]